MLKCGSIDIIKQINKEITYKLLLSTSLKFPITVEKANT